MAIALHSGTAPDTDDIAIRRIDLNDLRTALREGWRAFGEKRGDLLFVVLIYPVVALVAALTSANMSILPLLVPLAGGALLLGPSAASGFYELARRRQAGLDAGWSHFFDVYRISTVEPLTGLTALIGTLFLVWLAAAWMIYAATLGAVPIDGVAGFFHAVFATRAGWDMIVFGNLVGLGFAMVVLAMAVVSFPMLIDRPVGMAVALRTSLRVTLANPLTIAAWGMIVVALLVLGALPGLVGLGVVLPVLGYATWHLYTLAVVR